MRRIPAAALVAAAVAALPVLAEDEVPPTASGTPAATPFPIPTEAAPPGRPLDPPGEGEVAARGTTGICGVVIDATTNEPLVEAPVALVKGARGETRTDVDGRFSMQIAPGLYDLRARYELYQAGRVNGVAVVAGECTRVTIRLTQQEAGVDEVVVTARKDNRREAAVLAERKSAPVVQDAISAQEISRTPDGAASDAVKRIVSATVVDGKYVYLRGLGGRYSTVLLNGVPLPSPDADEHAVPLDLFPTSLLSSLNVVKTYSPELPGSFAGGTLEIETTPYPARFEAEVSASTWAGSGSTGRARRSYGGGSLDLLTFDDGTRSLPDLVPRDRALVSPQIDTAARIEATRAFRNQWSTTERDALPGFGFGATVGDTRALGGRKIGYLASIDYGAKESVKTSRVGVEARNPTATEPFRFDQYDDVEQGRLTADLSALVNVGYEAGSGQDLSLLALYTRSAESKAQRSSGLTFDGNRYQADRLQFVSRGMLFGQLRGEHRLGAGGLDLSWQGNLARVGRSEPDTRDVIYFAEGNAPLAWASRLAGSADRFFSEVTDTSGGGTLDLAVPVPGAKLRAGGSTQLSKRAFEARRFRFREPPRDGSLLTLPPEQLFAAGNIDEQFLLTEMTAGSDAYDARQQVHAGYLVADVPVGRVRIFGGARYEYTRLELTTGSRFAVTPAPAGVDRDESAFLPSANVVLALRDGMNLRAAYGHTVVRPQFRELAPFVFVDFDRKLTVEGNPDLETTRIHNADLRWEWFPRDEEVLAATAFYKRFRNPIELVIQTATGGQVKYQNAAEAAAWGLELEGRVGLRRIAPALADFRVAANLALVSSEVDLKGEAPLQTSQKRPLQGQSPYVVNASLGWARAGLEATLLYNVYGKRITEVGAVGLPDAYEQPSHRLDLTISRTWRALEVKLALANLLDSTVVIEQGGLEAYRHAPGLAGSLSLKWSR